MFFERPESGELAVLVHLEFPQHTDPDDPREFEELVLSAGGDPVAMISGHRATPHARYFVGTGKLEELRECVETHGAELVIFNHTLSPSQERNLEQELKCRVLDRTGLILDIFAQRARTHEGKLQVELAQLRHMSTRLIRGWTHLERQKGGIGLRGPGETQLETDRRLLRVRIKSIEKRLEKVRKQRDQGRRARRRAEVPTVSLVGYTNAGKSTLFNRITAAGVYAQDQLFATLDPTMRRIELPTLGPAVLADTVGFISHLPHRLVQAFRATLEEAASADLLLHVIDAAAEERSRNIEQVEEVLEEIGAADLPQLKVYNKIDLLEELQPRIDRNELGRPVAVWLSAQSGAGVELLLEALAELLGEDRVVQTLILAPAQARLRARLYACHAVTHEDYTDCGDMELAINVPKSDLLRILSQEHLQYDELRWH
ncbi:ribosome rescue GTPase HflX [Pseudomaricurvus sp. HS19]|uniref:ribosome rescue GTPase HflX n=1 Tax=Pseudomaricurvus sp. HS19 TaxID=2692626 RepID=UPI001367EAB8|nr:ribosome rescue GTPase HflX [Pseudomaricurvus sp. HS19]MYM63552.1 GTPase HflX [Pseudomaricurvus sp. HS19]